MSHPGRHITQYDIGELFAKAYYRAACADNAVSGFVKTGIRSCDMSVFTDADFAAAEVSERAEALVEGQPEAVDQSTRSVSESTEPPPMTHATPGPSHLQQSSHTDDPSPEHEQLHPCSSTKDPADTVGDVHGTSATPVSPADIRPYPRKQRAAVECRKRNKQLAEVLTSTLVKTALMEKKLSLIHI